MKELVFRLGLLLLSGLVFVGIGEIYFRVFNPQAIQPESIHEYVYGINNGLRANVHQRWTDKDYDVLVTTNAKRLRGKEYPYQKSQGVTRILALGDSFTFGFGVNVEDSYSKVLERLLNVSTEGNGVRQYEVINTGAPGWGTAQELVFWNVEGHKYNPDIILLCLVENDPTDNVNAGLFELRDEQVVQREPKKNLITNIRNVMRKIPLMSFLAQHSHFYNFVRMRALHVLYGQISQNEEADVLGIEEVSHKDAMQAMREESDQDLMIAILKRFISEIQESSKKLIVFDVPGTLAKFRKVQEFLRQQADEQTISLLDTRGFLKKHHQEEGTTYLYDGHWNINGHRLVGEMLADFILSNNLIAQE